MFLAKSSYHHSGFMTLAGGLSALANAASFALLAWMHDMRAPVYTQVVPLLLALTAFVAFARFQLLISARSMGWMLGRGALRWFSILFVALAALFFLPQAYADTAWLRALLAQWMVLALALQVAGLAVLRRVAHHINNAPASRRQAVFFGLGPEAQKLALRLQRSPILGIRVAGYYAPEPVQTRAAAGAVPVYLGRYPEALPRIAAGGVDIAFVTLDAQGENTVALDLMNKLYDSTADIYLMPESPFLDEFSASSADIAGVPMLALHETQMVGLARTVKRAMDLVLGGIALALALPLMLLIAAVVRLDSPGPVIFRQVRYGERGSPITVYKFRSMRCDAGQAEEAGVLRQASANDDRVTRVGRVLRRTSLDELPQLFNVMGGSMSLVGPRPHAAEHNELYRRLIRGYMLRHSVKPGITGWAQVNGLRGETDTPEKMRRRVEYDRYYIANWSLRLDMRILVRTLLLVFWDRNAY